MKRSGKKKKKNVQHRTADKKHSVYKSEEKIKKRLFISEIFRGEKRWKNKNADSQ